jgi:hypothetical protein
VENRESFERLFEKMLGTDYWRVSIRGLSGVDVTTSPGESGERFVIEDDPEWRELLVAVGMFMVLQQDGAVWAELALPGSQLRNQTAHSGFAHDSNMLDEFKVCLPEHEEIACGRCAIPLEDDWFIFYIWYPENYSEEGWVEANRQCHIDGYERMGYDIEKVLNLGDN